MHEMVMHTVEPVSTREATEILVKILNSTYVKADHKQVSNNATEINSEERTQLLSLPKYLEDFFDCTLGEWYIEPVDPELNPDSKPFSCKYYLVQN